MSEGVENRPACAECQARHDADNKASEFIFLVGCRHDTGGPFGSIGATTRTVWFTELDPDDESGWSLENSSLAEADA